MTFYLATFEDRPVWVTYQSKEDVWWVFVANTGRFYRNDAVFQDHQWDQEMTYLPIEPDEALALARDGVVGWIDPEAQDEILDSVTGGQESLDADVVLGEPVGVRTPAEREQAQARMLTSHPTLWIAWQSFGPGQEAAADQLANEIRQGQIPALAGAGALDVEVEKGDLGAGVLLRRKRG